MFADFSLVVVGETAGHIYIYVRDHSRVVGKSERRITEEVKENGHQFFKKYVNRFCGLMRKYTSYSPLH